MDLGITGPAGVLAEGRHGEPLRGHLVHPGLAPAGDGAVALEPGQGSGHSGVVSGQDLGGHLWVLGQRPEHRRGLGCREGGVEGQGRAVPEAPAYPLGRERMTRVQHPGQLAGLDLAVQPRGLRAGAPPAPGRLVVVLVVTGGAGGAVRGGGLAGLGLVVRGNLAKAVAGGLDGGHPQHDARPPGPGAPVCPDWWSIHRPMRAENFAENFEGLSEKWAWQGRVGGLEPGGDVLWRGVPEGSALAVADAVRLARWGSTTSSAGG